MFTLVSEVPMTVPLWVLPIVVTSSFPSTSVVVGKVQPVQVSDSIGPMTFSFFSILPLTVEPVHVSSASPLVVTRPAEVPAFRLKLSAVPAAHKFAAGQGDAWTVQKTDLVGGGATFGSTASVFSFGSVRVYSAI